MMWRGALFVFNLALNMALGSFVATDASAQSVPVAITSDYPGKPIRVVVPSSPGGGIDALARVIGPRLTEAWGKPIIIDNRAGAGGLIGSEIVARAPADGYTVLMVAGGYTLNPSIYAKLPYDTLRDFERVSLLACAPNLLVVHASLPIKTFKELIAYAKAKPNFLIYASSGVGTTSYLSGEIMKVMTGVDIIHVPYKGAGLSNAAAIAGQVHFIFSAPHTMVPHVKTERVRALGVSSLRRLPLIPDVPTIAESGLPGFDVNSCYGVLVPAGTPKGIVQRLNGEIVRALRVPEVKAQLEAQSFDVISSSADEHDRFVKQDMVRWAKILKQTGIKAE
jgi:tripartite-type tricarboxylate transporter receptor subunit TctC